MVDKQQTSSPSSSQSQNYPWSKPQTVFIVAKLSDPSLVDKVRNVAELLCCRFNCIVYIEDVLYEQMHSPPLLPECKDKWSQNVKAWNAHQLRKQTCPPNIPHIPSTVIPSSPDHDNNNNQDSIPNGQLQQLSDSDQDPCQQEQIQQKYYCKHDISLTQSRCPHEIIDLIITLGGDGTVLYASWLFQDQVPPILPFHLGSLGFLTVFQYSELECILDWVMREQPERGSIGISYRMRLTCEVYRQKTVRTPGLTRHVTLANPLEKFGCPVKQQQASSDYLQHQQQNTQDQSQCCIPPIPDESFQILNDIVVDRGPSAYISTLELFSQSLASQDTAPIHLTTVKADGIVIATPTGSTAYSLSAGGSICHPSVAALLVTPICPHTLSFRPVILPDNESVIVVVPEYKSHSSSCSAWVSFDGRHRVRLSQGDVVRVFASNQQKQQQNRSLPIIIKEVNVSADWFGSLARCLRWNERGDQTKRFIWGLGVVHDQDSADNNSDNEDLNGRLGRSQSINKDN
ncbi:hypothetical protein MP228_012825 [Amoeboaphelidium protococcarum]|nr:hypothetical protein MP228_012825 [Amoeboaphelidium protococcarum]